MPFNLTLQRCHHNKSSTNRLPSTRATKWYHFWADPSSPWHSRKTHARHVMVNPTARIWQLKSDWSHCLFGTRTDENIRSVDIEGMVTWQVPFDCSRGDESNGASPVSVALLERTQDKCQFSWGDGIHRKCSYTDEIGTIRKLALRWLRWCTFYCGSSYQPGVRPSLLNTRKSPSDNRAARK